MSKTSRWKSLFFFILNQKPQFFTKPKMGISVILNNFIEQTTEGMMKTNYHYLSSKIDDMAGNTFDDIFNNPLTIKKITNVSTFKFHKRLIKGNQNWTVLEISLYLTFLKNHFDLFDLSWSQKRKLNIHSLMSQFINSKNYAQCRIYHHKMIKLYRTVEGAIRVLQKWFSGQKQTSDKLDEYRGLKVEIEDQQNQNQLASHNPCCKIIKNSSCTTEEDYQNLLNF